MFKHPVAWAVAAACASSSLAAQEPERVALEEVVVTAERRAESLQTVPVSVTAINAEALEGRQVTNVIDIAAQVPNLRIETVTGLSNAARVFLRGVGEDQSTPTTDNAIGLYVDGVFYPRTLGALFDFVDVERIEVLRGPQGTLYGRNTSGGAIKIITRDPGDELSGTIEVGGGSYGRVQLRGAVGGPLSDSLRGSLSVLKLERDGTSRNVTLSRDVNRKDVQAARGKLVWDATDALELKLAVDWTEDNGDTGVPTSGFTGRPADLYVTAANANPTGYLRTRGASLTATWTRDQYTFTSITAWRDLQNAGLLDNDAEARTILHFAFEADQSQFSQEFTLNADWGRAQGILGAYWFEEDNTYLSTNFSGSRANAAAPVTATTGIMTQDTESYAVFGQVTFSLTDALRLTAGGRYTWDEKVFTDRYPALGRLFAPSKKWTAFTPRVAVDYKLNDDVFLFASWAAGYKAGGFNRSTVAVTALTPYDEEEVATAEVGVKAQFLDDRLRANLTYFHNDYEDLQLSAFDPVTNVSRRFNAAAATTKGVELEVSAVPHRSLRAYLSLGYLHAVYDEFFDIVGGRLVDVSFRDLKGAPRWSYSAGFAWDLPLPTPGLVRLNGDVSHRTRMENNVAGTPIIATGGTTLVNASLGWTSEDQRWSATLAGKNLTDKAYLGAGLFIGGLTTALYPAEPRTWTASVRYNF